MKLFILTFLFTSFAWADGKRLLWTAPPDGATPQGYNLYWDTDVPTSTTLSNGPVDVGNVLEVLLLDPSQPFVNGNRYCFEITAYLKDSGGIVTAESLHSERTCGLVVDVPNPPVGLTLAP